MRPWSPDDASPRVSPRASPRKYTCSPTSTNAAKPALKELLRILFDATSPNMSTFRVLYNLEVSGCAWSLCTCCTVSLHMVYAHMVSVHMVYAHMVYMHMLHGLCAHVTWYLYTCCMVCTVALSLCTCYMVSLQHKLSHDNSGSNMLGGLLEESSHFWL